MTDKTPTENPYRKALREVIGDDLAQKCIESIAPDKTPSLAESPDVATKMQIAAHHILTLAAEVEALEKRCDFCPSCGAMFYTGATALQSALDLAGEALEHPCSCDLQDDPVKSHGCSRCHLADEALSSIRAARGEG